MIQGDARIDRSPRGNLSNWTKTKLGDERERNAILFYRLAPIGVPITAILPHRGFPTDDRGSPFPLTFSRNVLLARRASRTISRNVQATFVATPHSRKVERKDGTRNRMNFTAPSAPHWLFVNAHSYRITRGREERPQRDNLALTTFD